MSPSGLWVVVSDQSGAGPVTSIDFTGLDGAVDDFYELRYHFECAVAGNFVIRFGRGDPVVWDVNLIYDNLHHEINTIGGHILINNLNVSGFLNFWVGADEVGWGTFRFYTQLATLYKTMEGKHCRSTNLVTDDATGRWRDNVNNVTGIRFTGPANGIANYQFTLLKKMV